MGPDGIPGWALKENADILARSILNMQNHAVKLLYLNLGSAHLSNIVPIPKEKPVRDINRHPRPFSLTPII